MQNRNMFLYRRQGPKKRTKPNTARKARGPQKGLPNSIRDLLPLMQPATKALAQMLAGRTRASGQLGHAKALLTHADRLVAERAHNRLNPAEREEFFEQIARLKLTLSDADTEAEVQAAEDEAPPVTAPQVGRARLREMAMAFATPGGAKRTGTSAKPSRENQLFPDAEPAAAEDAKALDALSTGKETSQNKEAVRKSAEDSVPDDPKRLRLPRDVAERVAPSSESGMVRTINKRRRTAPTAKPALKAIRPDEPTPEEAPAPAKRKPSVVKKKASEDTEPEQKTAVRARPKGLPEGWIIDDEGFVVPGPS